LTFIDGNPDRPVIAGAVANAETANVINSSTNRMGGLGTKGGGAIMFGEEPGKQKLVLSSGSERGAFTLSANSPTNAMIKVDAFNAVTINNTATAANKTSVRTGSESSTIADNSNFIAFSSLMQTLNQSIDVSGTFWDHQTSDNKNPAKPAGIFNKISGAMSLATDAFNKLDTFVTNMVNLKKAAVRPHSNLVSLSASGTGAKHVLKSKKTSNLTIVNFCALLSNVVKAVADVDKVIETDKDTSDYEASKGDYADKDKPSDADKNMKRTADGISDGTALVDALSSLLSDLALGLAMYTFGGPPKGILINNTDSYINVKANHSASLSGYGPAIVESYAASMGDILRHGVTDTNAPIGLIRPDLLPPGTPSYENSKSVLLLGELIRARAHELNLEAKDYFMARSGSRLQLIAGLPPAGVAGLATYEGTYAVIKNLVTAWQEAPDEEAKTAAMFTLLNVSREFLELNFPVPPPEVQDPGIIAKTYGAQSPIFMQTTDPSSIIQLIQGAALRADPNSRSVKLSSTGTTIQEDQNTKIELQQGTKAAMQFNAQTALTLNAQEAKLNSGPSSSLTLTSDSAELKTLNSATLEAGGNKLAVAATGITGTVGGISFKITPVGIQAG
jgi:hypothetical protein